MKTTITSRTENQAECLKITKQVVEVISLLIETSNYQGSTNIVIEPFNNGYSITMDMSETTATMFRKYTEKEAEYIMKIHQNCYVFTDPSTEEYYLTAMGNSCHRKTAKEIIHYFTEMVMVVENPAK